MKIKNKNAKKTGGFDNRLFIIKLHLAVFAGKLLFILTRILGRGGTTLPGKMALRLAPEILSSLSDRLPAGSLIVTGTNGKTTTSALITGILKISGLKCIHNQSGSNLSWGVASTLINAASWSARMTDSCAVLEVDEGAFPGVVGSIQPRGVVVTNIFRDQLDRYGEIDLIRNSINRGINALPVNSFQILNADDPSLISMESNTTGKRWTYGLSIKLSSDTILNTGRDIKTCPRCNHILDYDQIYFAHLGHFRCPSCSYRRPDPDIKLTNRKIRNDGSAILEISIPGGKLEITTRLQGIYNLYNILAAVTCALALDIPRSLIIDAVEKAVPSFGRMELLESDGKNIMIALIKNPVGANEVIRTLLEDQAKLNLLVAINDRIADGTDVSWLWDVDFEQLTVNNKKITAVSVSGQRAWDMAVRFKYAGLDNNQIQVEEDTARALKICLEKTKAGEKLLILPTYTAMLEIRRSLNKMGIGKPYWEV